MNLLFSSRLISYIFVTSLVTMGMAFHALLADPNLLALAGGMLSMLSVFLTSPASRNA